MTKEGIGSYVEFYLSDPPSSSYAIKEVVIGESLVTKIDKRDLSKIKIPENAFGYIFFDRREYISKSGEMLTGQKINKSPMHFFGKIITLENIAKEVSNPPILLSIMKEKGYERMVKTIRGNFQPLNKNDIVIEREDPFLYMLDDVQYMEHKMKMHGC